MRKNHRGYLLSCMDNNRNSNIDTNSREIYSFQIKLQGLVRSMEEEFHYLRKKSEEQARKSFCLIKEWSQEQKVANSNWQL